MPFAFVKSSHTSRDSYSLLGTTREKKKHFETQNAYLDKDGKNTLSKLCSPNGNLFPFNRPPLNEHCTEPAQAS